MAMKQKIEITAKDKTRAAANSVKRSLGGVSSAAASMGAQLGLAFGVGGMAFAIKQSLDAADKIQKLSIRLGASTEALSQYNHVAKLSGVRIETLTMGWQRMTRRVAEAAIGTGEARGALQELGISATELTKLRPEDQFEVLAEAISKVGTQSDKVRLSMKLFDSEGVSLLQTMEGGAEGIRKMRKEADLLGLTLSRDQVDAAAAANDAIARMTSANKALTQQMAIEFAPTIEAVAEFLGKSLPEAADFTSAAFADIRKAMGLAVAGIVTGLIELYDVLEELPGNFGAPYKTAKEEMLLFREAVFETIDQISAKQEEAAKVGLPTGEDGDEKKSIAAEMFGTEEEIQDDMDLALDMISKQFDALDVLHIQRLAGLNKIHKDAATDREKFMGKSATGQTKQVLGEMVKMTQGVSRQNRALFEINKAAATANAVIGAWQGAARTMGEYPYPFNIALAGLSLVSGMAQVQAIQSTSFGGGGGGGSISGGGGVPSLAGTIPSSELPALEAAEPAQSVEIIVSGGLHTDDDVRNLVERINEVQTDMGGQTKLVAVSR